MVLRTQSGMPGMALQASSRTARISIFLMDSLPPEGGELTFVNIFIEDCSPSEEGELTFPNVLIFSNDSSLPEGGEQTCVSAGRGEMLFIVFGSGIIQH